MPVFQQLLDNDKLYNSISPGNKPVIINDIHNTTSKDREFIERLITTTYSSDMVSILPSCKCGLTKGEFSKNTTCEYCGTMVSASIETTIEPLVWFRRPQGVERLMSPIIWIMLDNRFTKSRYSILRYLTDTAYNPPVNRPAVIAKIDQQGIRRGYNYFVQNFFPVIEFLLSLKEFKPKGIKKDYLQDFLYENQHILFSDYIPLMNKSLLIIEKTTMATYIDTRVPLALNAMEMLVSIDKDFYDQSITTKENRTARAMYLLSCKFFNAYFRNIVASKPGLLRHYVGGSRFDYTARAVIASITDEHKYDEIVIPWGIGLTIFRPMLINKLIKKADMLVNDAVGMLIGHVGIYHPLLDQYLQEIIAETREKRYPVLFNRFPSLLQGSIQKVYIPKVKTDPKDLTLDVSILIVTAPNAD